MLNLEFLKFNKIISTVKNKKYKNDNINNNSTKY